jgi:hypothetical protein
MYNVVCCFGSGTPIIYGVIESTYRGCGHACVCDMSGDARLLGSLPANLPSFQSDTREILLSVCQKYPKLWPDVDLTLLHKIDHPQTGLACLARSRKRPPVAQFLSEVVIPRTP